MTNETLVKILTGKQRGKKTTRRFGNGLVRSTLDIDTTDLSITSDEDDDKNYVHVASTQHFTYKKSVETEVRIDKVEHHAEPYAVIDLNARQTIRAEEVGHDDEITVRESSRTFLSVDDLVTLRDQITKAIRKAKRQDLI